MVGSTVQNKVTLYCRESGSDKVYALWLEEKGGAWLVQFQFGRRGGTQQTGTKTPEPVTREKAEQVYGKILREKLGKGYHEGEDAPAFSQVDGAKDTGVRPMLLTTASEEDLDRLIGDAAWAAQEKLNGKRILIRRTVDGSGAGTVAGINRRGLECPIPKRVEDVFFDERWPHVVLDGEMVGTTYHIFDLLEGIADERQRPLADRHTILREMLRPVPPCMRLVDLVMGPEAKRSLVKRLRAERREGVVFKRLDGRYEPGLIENLKNALAVKVKFYAEGDFVVLRLNEKRSAEVGAAPDARGRCVSVGNVSVPAKYAPEVKVGSVVRVKYLYATTGGRLYQPFLNPTDDGRVTQSDVLPAECLLSQLKFEGKEDE